jgi:hypothetical protein
MPGTEDGQSHLTTEQAYEAAYRFVAQYYKREPIEPFLLMLASMEPTPDRDRTSDPASWADWEQCVHETLSCAPLPGDPDLWSNSPPD